MSHHVTPITEQMSHDTVPPSLCVSGLRERHHSVQIDQQWGTQEPARTHCDRELQLVVEFRDQQAVCQRLAHLHYPNNGSVHLVLPVVEHPLRRCLTLLLLEKEHMAWDTDMTPYTLTQNTTRTIQPVQPTDRKIGRSEAQLVRCGYDTCACSVTVIKFSSTLLTSAHAFPKFTFIGFPPTIGSNDLKTTD